MKNLHYGKTSKDEQRIKHVPIKRICIQCGHPKKTKQSKLCEECHGKSLRKVKDRPCKEQLLNDIKELGYRGTGRKYGVSDNAIKRNKGSEHYGLFSVMVKKRDGKDVKMGEMEFTKLLTSTVTRLKKGIGFLIDAEEMQDFLSKQK